MISASSTARADFPDAPRPMMTTRCIFSSITDNLGQEREFAGQMWQRVILPLAPDAKDWKALSGNAPYPVRKAARKNAPCSLSVNTSQSTFFRGTSLRPVPPGGTGKDARWIDIHEDDLDEAQMATWVKQAAALPGWVPGRPS